MDRFRHEYKYMINSCEEAILKIRAGCFLDRDAHANDDGEYIIRSLYFDDDDGSCYKENEDGTDPRSKFRIRYYNNDTERIMLEKKTKKRGMTYKESCTLTKEEVGTILKDENLAFSKDDSGMKNRLIQELFCRNLKPKVIVTYKRMPFVYTAGNVRITFDGNITSSDEIECFLNGNYRERPILEKGKSILEVKWDEVLPRHIKESMQLETLRWTSFSKFYMCLKHHL